MSQDEQLDRLRKLRAARGETGTRLEPAHSNLPPGYPANWPIANPVQPSPTRGRAGAFVGLLILLVIAGGAIGGVAYVLNKFHSSVGGPRKTVQFVVSQGESVGQIANQLEKDGLVSSSTIFQWYYRFNGGSGNIQSGPHTLNTDMSMDTIAQALQTQVVAVVTDPTANQFNILGGKRAEEIATILNKYHIASYDAVMHEVRYGKFDYWFLKGLPAGATLEGFLAPGKYTLLPHSNPHSVIALMLRRFGQNFTPAMRAKALRDHRSVFQIVTMASIVQRENAFPKVQRMIAGVYYNRLSNIDTVDMRLDADPTVQYALGYSKTEKTWWRNSLDQTITHTFQSPYNTYINQGLPPGPISNPGLNALNAALNPTPSPYLFFQVLTPDGKHSHTYFCATLDCQNNHQGVAIQ